MTKKLLIISFFLIFSLISCNQSSPSTEVESSSVDESAKSTHGSSEIAESQKSDIVELENTNGSANTLASREWNLPPKREDEWKQVKEYSYTDTIRFKDVNSVVVLNFTALSKDTSNYIIKSANIHVIKHDKNFTLSARINDQVNMGTRQALNTYFTAQIFATRNSRVFAGTKLEGKVVAAFAKGGEVKHM